MLFRKSQKLYQLITFINRYMEPEKKELFVPQYLQHTYLFELKTKIAQINGDQVLFEDTIFHPQGGGQPNDKGYMELLKNASKIDIMGATMEKQSGKIWNKLQKVDEVAVGDQVLIKIDEEARRRHAKIHSSGHILDLAVQNLKYPWTTTKGYHFVEGPYVEYKGVIENNEKMMAEINEEVKKILGSGIQTVKEHYSYEEAVEKGLIPKQFKTPLIRVIKFAHSSCPCGGTHIEKITDIQSLEVTKLQKKGKNIKAYYQVV